MSFLGRLSACINHYFPMAVFGSVTQAKTVVTGGEKKISTGFRIIPHTVHTCERIPRGSVGNAVIERRCARFARHTLVHRWMVPGVGQRQMFEHVVIGRQRWCGRVTLEHCKTRLTVITIDEKL